MDLQTVRYAVDGAVARIELNRPERHNALNGELLEDLDTAFAAAEADDAVRAVVLSGAGRSFCSGYDTSGSPYITPPEGGWTKSSALLRLRGIEARYQRIWDCPKPTVARVHGNALAAGCYLQLLCDITVAATDARLGHPAVRFGGVSSMPLWQMALGLKKARYLLLTGRIIDGAEAERIGLVSLAVPPDELDATVEGIVADLVAIPADGAMHNKIALNTALSVRGAGALFRYHGEANALGRLAGGDPYR
jgi:enoyl-CoA hydratase